MNFNQAKEIRDHVLASIEDLSRALNAAQKNCSEEDFLRLKKGIGMSIIKIDTDVLGVIYKNHPELDHIKKD